MGVINHLGPNFEIASDELIIIGGHSERKEALRFLAETIGNLGLFKDITIKTINNLDTKHSRGAIYEGMKKSTVMGHSAALTRVPAALQIIAINRPEQLDYRNEIKCAIGITRDVIDKEEGAHKTGSIDMLMAGIQMFGSPISSVRTMRLINSGFSATKRLAEGEVDFPAGRALVHSELDGFGFAANANMQLAASCGVTTLLLPEHHHNEVLFAPQRTIDMMTPSIFPLI